MKNCREVKLPGKDSNSPQSFAFGTPYVEIRDFLARQNEALFRRNSVLGLLERDAATKRAPERWQSLDSEDVASFDVVVCFESRVFDLVVEGSLVAIPVGVESLRCQSWCRRCVFVIERGSDRAEVQRETASVVAVAGVSETDVFSGGCESYRALAVTSRITIGMSNVSVVWWNMETRTDAKQPYLRDVRWRSLPFCADKEAPPKAQGSACHHNWRLANCACSCLLHTTVVLSRTQNARRCLAIGHDYRGQLPFHIVCPCSTASCTLFNSTCSVEGGHCLVCR